MATVMWNICWVSGFNIHITTHMLTLLFKKKNMTPLKTKHQNIPMLFKMKVQHKHIYGIE